MIWCELMGCWSIIQCGGEVIWIKSEGVLGATHHFSISSSGAVIWASSVVGRVRSRAEATLRWSVLGFIAFGVRMISGALVTTPRILAKVFGVSVLLAAVTLRIIFHSCSWGSDLDFCISDELNVIDLSVDCVGLQINKKVIDGILFDAVTGNNNVADGVPVFA